MIPKSGYRFPAFAKPASAGEGRSEKIMRKQNVKAATEGRVMSEQDEKRPKNLRADLYPVEGFALTVDGKFKSQYPDMEGAMKVGSS